MFKHKNGGLKFRLKGAKLTGFTDIEGDVKSTAFCPGRFDSKKEDLKKSGSVKKGDILIDNSNYTVLSPVTGSISFDGCKVVITSSGDSAVSDESKSLLEGDKVQALMKLGLLDRRDVSTLKRVFINLTHTEPFMAKDDFMLEKFSETFVQSISTVEDLFGGKEVIGIYSSDKVGEVLDELGLKSYKVKKYPFDNEKLLACKYEKKKAADLNPEESLLVPVESMLVINDFLNKQIPPTYSYVSVAGNIDSPELAKVPLFSDLKEVAGKYTNSIDDYELVVGGVFSGRSFEDYSYFRLGENALTLLNKNKPRKLWSFTQPGFTEDSSTPAFLSSCLPFDKYNDNQMHGELRACVFCGACESICPAKLIPHVLYKHADIDALEEAKQYRIMDCIDCGLCSYSCVSKISIAEKITHGKEQIIKQDI